MFVNEELKKHLEESSSIKSQSAVIAEWNMNIPTNISLIGNYRYRPSSQLGDYSTLPNTFDIFDNGYYYTNATDADVVVDGTVNDDGLPTTLISKNKKNELLYSLEDCFKPFRPRSGINKARYIEGKFLHHSNINLAKRPRYYMPDKNDNFKYWSSYRNEVLYKHTYSNNSVVYSAKKSFTDLDGSAKNGTIHSNEERGISTRVNGQNYISDAVPFVVYKDPIPTNRIVVKMQTHVGTYDFGNFSNQSTSFPDPFYGNLKKQTPEKWKIQALKNNNWVDIIKFDSASKRSDNSDIIKPDGYVELAYGLKIPDQYKDIFVYAETLSSDILLPQRNVNGYAYLIVNNENSVGEFHIWVEDNNDYDVFVPEYGWYLQEETVDRLTNFVTKISDPLMFIDQRDNSVRYREFQNIQGIRVVVDTMATTSSVFDLIEISPRLSVDLTNVTTDFKITKSASDLGVSGLPVSQLLAATGDLNIFDHDNSFNENNPSSIIGKYLARHVQFKFYEVIVNLDGYDYFVPIKTMYSESFPKTDKNTKKVSMSLKDLYFYLDSVDAPQMLMTNVSVSSAISLLLDSIGFANYTIKRLTGESEEIIPYFFIAPDKTVAQVLQDIAISSQTAMFFDEYNNFVVMSKNYMMPSLLERPTDMTLYGTKDFTDTGVLKNSNDNSRLANIIDVSAEDRIVYNGGKINYTNRYIQRSYGSIKQASMIDQDKTWIYKPVLLWEVSGTENTKSINNEVGNQSTYMLSAIPLNVDLSELVPTVSNRRIINNTINLGEAVYWITRYNGYFYSSGEVIKFDAVEYNVPTFGNVWISSVREYQDYFSKLPFNAKIYPTGLIRIYTEPNYEEINGTLKLKNGDVAKHGRGQFGTSIVKHHAGINPYWSNNSNVRGCSMDSKHLFETGHTLPVTAIGPAGVDNATAQKSVRTGIIKNFLSSSNVTETDLAKLSTQSGTIQSSALVMNGPQFTTSQTPRDFISYVYKNLDNKYRHFGTRMRIVGKIENNLNKIQTANGSTSYFTVPGTTPEKTLNISGGSGGLAVMIDPATNNGYYFEIVALGTSKYSTLKNVNNIIFYKVQKDSTSNKAIPVKLWESLGQIIVDDGKFTGQYRMSAEKDPTVYDLAVEYLDVGNVRRFYLYINGKLLKIVEDVNPMPKYNNMAVFVRGSARCMFENLYALTSNYSSNTSSAIDTPVNSIFDTDELNTNESFKKYAMSGIIQGTYLSGVSPSQPPQYQLYFEEFGSIMREASLFNVKYDKAYPALYAKLSPTFNRIKGYSVSGFRAGAYGAEFMIFNATDTALSLDSSSGNYLRIQGITFTQENPNTLSVDDYYSRNSDLSTPKFTGDSLIRSPFKVKKDYEDIKLSRMAHGLKEFSIDSPYIQSQDAANSLMSWLTQKIMKPRKSVGLKVFAVPTLQLGDIVTINYSEQGIDIIDNKTKRFVVYNIEYSKDPTGPSMTVFVSEV
jgi:hypothetical protein